MCVCEREREREREREGERERERERERVRQSEREREREREREKWWVNCLYNFTAMSYNKDCQYHACRHAKIKKLTGNLKIMLHL